MTPIRVILETVESIREAIEGDGGPLAVLDAIRPLLIEFSMSPGVLTDEHRDAIQGKVLDTLRDARLIPTADFGGGPS